MAYVVNQYFEGYSFQTGITNAIPTDHSLTTSTYISGVHRKSINGVHQMIVYAHSTHTVVTFSKLEVTFIKLIFKLFVSLGNILLQQTYMYTAQL